MWRKITGTIARKTTMPEMSEEVSNRDGSVEIERINLIPENFISDQLSNEMKELIAFNLASLKDLMNFRLVNHDFNNIGLSPILQLALFNKILKNNFNACVNLKINVAIIDNALLRLFKLKRTASLLEYLILTKKHDFLEAYTNEACDMENLNKTFDRENFNQSINKLLFTAIDDGNLECVNILLKAGADLSHVNTNNKGYSPLAYAALKGNLPICQRLVEQGALIQHPINSYLNPLVLAECNRHENIFMYFIRTSEIQKLIDKKFCVDLECNINSYFKHKREGRSFDSLLAINIRMEKALENIVEVKAFAAKLNHFAKMLIDFNKKTKNEDIEGRAQLLTTLGNYLLIDTLLTINESFHSFTLCFPEFRENLSLQLIESQPKRKGFFSFMYPEKNGLSDVALKNLLMRYVGKKTIESIYSDPSSQNRLAK